MVDMVVHRPQLRPTLPNLCRLLTKARTRPPAEPKGQTPAISDEQSAVGPQE